MNNLNQKSQFHHENTYAFKNNNDNNNVNNYSKFVHAGF